MLCSICFSEIPAIGSWTEGNNAEPVNMGRCCNDCNDRVVIPARLNSMGGRVPQATYVEMVRAQFESMGRMLAFYDQQPAQEIPAGNN